MFGLGYNDSEEEDPRLDPSSDHDLWAQCVRGHIFLASPEIDLGKRLILREVKGFQPECVQSHECLICIEEESEFISPS